jgi:hypothetical protein
MDNSGTENKRSTIFPIGSLLVCENAQCNDYRYSGRGEDPASIAPSSREIGNGPGESDVEADVRQVRVTICSGLQSDLYQSNYGHEHDEEP